MNIICLIKCRRIVSKSVDELSKKTCRRRRHSGIFRYVLPPSFSVVNIKSLHLHLIVKYRLSPLTIMMIL